MSYYVKPVRIALLISPYLGLVFALNYSLIRYKKAKYVPVNRSAYIYLFSIYCLCAYFMTMLPFPTIESVERLNTPYFQLIPFAFVVDFFNKSGIVITELNTFFPALKSGAFLVILFNVVMTVPFGLLLRHIFDYDLKKVTLLTLLLSLIFELTQLSGLFFIYPRPYRIFDVDDLITNTLGGVVGYLIYPMAKPFMPTANWQDGRKVLLGIDVSVIRRTACAAVDAVIMVIMACGVKIGFLGLGLIKNPRNMQILYFIFLCVIPIYHTVCYYLFDGQTPGILFAGVKLCSKDRTRASLKQVLIRAMIFYGGIYSMPYLIWILLTLTRADRPLFSLMLVAISAYLTFLFMEHIFSLMLYAVTRGYTLFYDKVAGTKLIFEHEILGLNSVRVRKLYTTPLWEDNINDFAEKAREALLWENIADSRYALMVKAVLKDWINAGFAGNTCQLCLDRRFFRKALILSVISDTPLPLEDFLQSEEMDYINGMESETEKMRNLRLSIDTYSGEGKNYCAIDIEDGE